MPIRFGDLEATADGLFAHWWMGAQGDHDVQSFGYGPKMSVKDVEQETHRRRPRAVGHDHQDFLATVVRSGTCLGNWVDNRAPRSGARSLAGG